MRSRVLWGLLLSPLPRTICHVVNCDRWFEKRHSRIKYICHFSSVFGDYIIIPWLLLLLLLLSHFSRVQLFATPWTAAHQVPPSMVFSRQEYWSGVPLPSPEINTNKSQILHPGNLSKPVSRFCVQPSFPSLNPSSFSSPVSMFI